MKLIKRAITCRNCTHYTAYYKRWATRFGKLPRGFCEKQQLPKNHSETCKNFTDNKQKELLREKLLIDCLAQSIKSINEIAQILKEKYPDFYEEFDV